MKRLLTRGALLLLLCALLAASGFADVKAEAVCQQDVLFCTDAGLMTGTGRNTFSPDRPMTRAMLVTALWREAGSPVVNYAMDKGLVQGYMQQKSSAKEEYTPSFDLTGV